MMKKIMALAGCICAISLYAMNQDRIITYDEIPFETPEQAKQNLPVLPADIQADIDAWNTQNRHLIEDFSQLPSTSQAYEQSQQKRTLAKQTGIDQGKHSHIFKTDKAVIRVPNLRSAVMERLSALGADPYNEQQVARVGGRTAALETEKPRQQGISRLIAQRNLLRSNNPAIKTVEAWAYPLGSAHEPLDDRHYVIVQRKLPNNLKSFDSLTSAEKAVVFKSLPLKNLYNAMKSTALWEFKGEDVYVNPENNQELWLIDLEKPNNEAYDPTAAKGQRGNVFRNVALYGKDKDKWKFNVFDNGFPQIRNWIQQHAPERVAEWEQLKTSDADSH